MENIEELLKELFKKKNKPLHFGEIVNALKLKKEQKKELKKALKKLLKEKVIIARKGKFIYEEELTIKGTVIANQAGFGFLEVENEEKDIYIPFFEMERVFDGDKVEAKITTFKGKKEVRIIKVLKRAKKEFVCIINKKDKKCFGIPTDKNSFHKIEIAFKDCKNLKEGTFVLVKITRFKTKELSHHQGKIEKVFGHPDDKSFIIEILKLKYNLKEEYPKKALLELRKFLQSFDIKKEIKKRKDLRDQFCFTIDPPSAKDFDDAVYVEKEKENFRLFVHIADVSSFVKFGSELDKEAYKRGCTVYLPSEAIHMLPSELSSDLCSLVPNKDRLCFTCEMVFDKRGELIDYSIYKSVINSKRRFTYDEVLSILKGEKEEEQKIKEVLYNMESLFRILNKKRWDKGNIDFDLPETNIILDENGEPQEIVPYERHVAHKIIEEFMIAANETVAFHLLSKEKPCLYRVHDKPDEEKVQKFITILSSLGYKVSMPKEITPKFFQKIIADFEDKKEENLIRFLALRTMKRAYYSPFPIGHFGLASDHYSHFTSPIRRYPDLILHRLLTLEIENKDFNEEYTKLSYLEDAAKHLSEKEREAEKIEREAIELLKLRFMKDKIGEKFEGIITGVISAGVFVELKDYVIEGFIPIQGFKDDEYVYDEENQRIVGIKKGKVYRLGDILKVKVISVDEKFGKMELSPL